VLSPANGTSALAAADSTARGSVLPSIEVGARFSIECKQDLISEGASAAYVQPNAVNELTAERSSRMHALTPPNEIQSDNEVLDANTPLVEDANNTEIKTGSCAEGRITQGQAADPITDTASSAYLSESFATTEGDSGSLLWRKHPSSIVETASSMFEDKESGGVSLDDAEGTPSFESYTSNSKYASLSSNEDVSSTPSSSAGNSPTPGMSFPASKGTLSLYQADAAIQKCLKRRSAPVALGHDRSTSGSTLVGSPTWKPLTPTAFELDFLTRRRAAVDTSRASSPASAPSTPSQASDSKEVEPQRLENALMKKVIADLTAVKDEECAAHLAKAKVDTRAEVEKECADRLARADTLSVDKEKLLNTVNGPESPNSTPMLTHIDKIKADYKEAEGLEWITLRAWTEIWHQAEIKELEAQISVAEGTIQSREVDIANKTTDCNAMTNERDQAAYTLEVQSRQLRSLVKKKNTCANGAKTAKQEKEQLEKELIEVKRVAQFDTETANGVRYSLEEELRGKNELIGLLSNGNVAVAEVLRLRAEVHELRTRKEKHNRECNELHENLDFARARLGETEAEVEELQSQNKYAGLEVGFLHAINTQYRWTLEDGNPARSAEFDGRLKRMNEEQNRLEAQVAEYSAALEVEKQTREADKEQFMEQFKEEQTKLKFQTDAAMVSESSRQAYRKHNGEVLEMLKGKLWPNDIIEAITKDKEILREDNELLLSVIHERECRIQDAKELESSLNVEIIELAAVVKAAQEKVRQTEININGLELHNDRLALFEELQEPFVKIVEDNKHLKALAKEQGDRIQQMIQEGPNKMILEDSKAKDRRIEDLQVKATKLLCYNNQWAQHDVENREGFCYVHNAREVVDWTSEEMRTRLKFAEQAYAEISKELEDKVGPGHEPWAQHKPLTETDGPFYG